MTIACKVTMFQLTPHSPVNPAKATATRRTYVSIERLVNGFHARMQHAAETVSQVWIWTGYPHRHRSVALKRCLAGDLNDLGIGFCRQPCPTGGGFDEATFRTFGMRLGAKDTTAHDGDKLHIAAVPYQERRGLIGLIG